MNNLINLHLLKKSAKIVTQNIGGAVLDSVSAGVGLGAKGSIQKIKEYSDLSNEALYFLQIKTFLETVDLDDEEVNSFFEKNKDEYRLGIEVFKILDSTYIERQAVLLAINFRNYVKNKIDKSKFNQYTNLIMKFDSHIFNLIDEDLSYPNKKQGIEYYWGVQLPEEYLLDEFDESYKVISAFIDNQVSDSRDLKNLGLIDETFNEIQNSYSGVIKPSSVLKRSNLYLEFYLDIYRHSKHPEH